MNGAAEEYSGNDASLRKVIDVTIGNGLNASARNCSRTVTKGVKRKLMSDSPLSCDFPETDIEQQLDKRLYRTYGERLASPPARKVQGVSDSSEELDYGIACINSRYMDIRTAFMIFRRFQLVPINLFMMALLFIIWVADQFFYGVFVATSSFLLPMWMAVYLFEVFFPLSLPIRIDRESGFLYVAHRGTFYRVPWDEMEVSFSYNMQYLGSGVVWERQYYSHLYLREEHFFCGKFPDKALQRKKISSTFNEKMMYRRWNFIVKYYSDGITEKDRKELVAINYDTYRRYAGSKVRRKRVFGYLILLLFMPSMFWWKVSPFKFKWPKEIESIFGKSNNY